MQVAKTIKIVRTDKDYGGGSGKTIFESNLFTVIVWKASKGTYTELQCELIPGLEIKFAGVQDLDTDEKCLEQLTVSEIIQIIDYQKSEAFEMGRMDKVKEIRRCLDF